ncbi:MAG: four helix bundle protein [Thermodesulfobacteriota bacterium]|nr:four helix bundle protein [Thermodesulfobacteriota bacterium]
MEKKLVRTHHDLEVYQMAFEAAMKIFQESKSFPSEERYSLTDQVRRSSRSVCANLSEAWRKRRYEASFVSKLSDAEAEAAETQVWLEFALKCGYLSENIMQELSVDYDNILGKIVSLINNPQQWLLPGAKRR